MMKPHYVKPLLFLLSIFLLNFNLKAQNISGTITDTKGETLAGVNILVKGTLRGEISDENGIYTIAASEGDILVFSFIGMLNQEIAVGSSNTIDMTMTEDATTLSDVVISSTRQPVRKLETTTAVSVISPKIIESIRPEGFSEAIQGTPGVYTSQSQGRFRGAIFIRGFPDGSGNGLVYTGILIDGLPSLATTARPPDFAFGMDPNVERIEVVRGSAATLFGRASAAGVINVISKVGGEDFGGMMRWTNYNENVDSRDGNDFKIEGNLNGPITKNLRFNIGGFYVNDRGFRDLGYNDRGGQFRANIDYLMGDKGSIRLYGGKVNLTIQNMIDIPYRLSDHKPKEGWETTDSYYSEALDNWSNPFFSNVLGYPEGSFQITDRDGETQFRSIQEANEEGNYARGGNIGLKFDYAITDNFIISNNFRYQSYDHGTKFNLGVSDFYFNDPNNYSTTPDPLNLRILIDGDGTDTDFMDEFRITIPTVIGNSKHNFSLGTYLSRGEYTPETYSWFHLQDSKDPNKPTFGFFSPLLDPTGNPIYLPPDSSTISVPTIQGPNGSGVSPVPFGSAARRDEYTIKVFSFFAGDEMKFNEKTTVNVGVRYDQVKMDLSGFYNSPNDVKNREEEHSDFSFSIGANQLLNDRSSVYGNFVSAFRMPDYGAYTPVDPDSYDSANPENGGDNPRLTDNERITNGELGYRTGLGDLGLDAAGFYTHIANRLATVYEGAVAVLKPLGTNQIIGGELALTYVPSSISGLLLRGSVTYQKATFQDFVIPVEDANIDENLFGNKIIEEGAGVYSIDLKGKQIPRVPSTIINLNANYDMKYFGINAQLNYFANRYADATNIYKQPNIANVNLGIYGRLPFDDGTSLKVSLLAKNLLDTDDSLRFLYISDNDAALAKAQEIDRGDASEETTYYTGIPYLPRRILVSVAYEF